METARVLRIGILVRDNKTGAISVVGPAIVIGAIHILHIKPTPCTVVKVLGVCVCVLTGLPAVVCVL